MVSDSTRLYENGIFFLGLRRIAEARMAFDRAERAGFTGRECAAGRWMCWMLAGEFERAWAESASIAESGEPDPHRFWNGEPMDGKRVILRCLHGLGDAIQFIRFVPRIRPKMRSLIVEAPAVLVRLLRCVAGVDAVVSWTDPDAKSRVIEWDCQMEINELPRIVGVKASDLPGPIPYLAVPPEVSESSPLAVRPDGQRRLGLVWRSSDFDPSRSLPLGELLEALNGWKGRVYSLQLGSGRAELAPNGISIVREEPADVLETAGDMTHLDLVISVDTMTAHLAGALGKPVWVLLPFAADWRWMMDRADSPWYPSMRLFRQKTPGDWTHPLGELGRAARAF